MITIIGGATKEREIPNNRAKNNFKKLINMRKLHLRIRKEVIL